MSRTRSNNTGSSNPSSKFLEWDTQESKWEFYDRDLKESKFLPSNTAFIVLDQLNTAKGWDERKGGMWANEVRSVKDTLTVKCKDGVIATGTWQEVKPTSGIKFTKSVYAMAKVGDIYELVNFQLKGCSLTAWIEFQDEIGGQSELEGDVVVSVSSVVEDKKGAVRFNKPVFSIVSRSLTDDAAAQADHLDSTLQNYLDDYFGQAHEEPKSEPAPATTTTTTTIMDDDLDDSDQIPF